MTSWGSRIDLTGELIEGRYRVRSPVGTGGMGTVYLAVDEKMRREVVLKVPDVRLLAVPGFKERFERETRSLVDLDHPHIVKVHDAGAHGDVPYIVLQYLRGGSLHDRWGKARGKLPPERVAAWLMPVAEALDFIHSRRLVHRDVKPGNILFDADGQVYLADFGIAKALGNEDTGITQSGMSPGSPIYMPPEAARLKKPGPAYDQYSLAVVAYRALCGELPHGGETPYEIAIQKNTEEPRPLQELARDLPPAACAAVMRALAREPNDRFPTCTAFVRAFEQGLGAAHRDGKQKRARPADPEGESTADLAGLGRMAREDRDEEPANRAETRLTRGRVAGIAGVLAVAAAAIALGVLEPWERGLESPGPGPVPYVQITDPTGPVRTHAASITVRGTIRAADVRTLLVGVGGERRRVAVGADGAFVAAVSLPAEDGTARVAFFEDVEGGRQLEPALEVLVDRTPPRLQSEPTVLGLAPFASEDGTVEAKLPFDEPVTVTTDGGTRCDPAPSGPPIWRVPLPGSTASRASSASVTLHAIDRAGNACAAPIVLAIEVYSRSAMEAEKEIAGRRPVVRIDAPVDGLRTRASSITVRGSVTEAPPKRVVVAAGGSARAQTVAVAADGSFQAEIALEREGPTRIDCSDELVPQAAAAVTIVVDRTPPKPRGDPIVAGSSPHAVEERVVQVKLDFDEPVELATGSGARCPAVPATGERSTVWEVPLPACPRARPVRQELTLLAVDGAGNAAASPIALVLEIHSRDAAALFASLASSRPDVTAAADWSEIDDVERGRLVTEWERSVAAAALDPADRDELLRDPEWAAAKLVKGPPPLDPNAPRATMPSDCEAIGPERDRVTRLPLRIRHVETGIELAFIPGGTYLRGSEAHPETQPVHSVRISQPSYLGRFEVTNAQFRRAFPEHRSSEVAIGRSKVSLDDDGAPVVHVTAEEVDAFCARFGFRLPTEAQWEWAASAVPSESGNEAPPRGATVAAMNSKDLSHRQQSGEWPVDRWDDRWPATAPVGSFAPNPLGLHDLFGNVEEMCRDEHEPVAYERFAAGATDPLVEGPGAVRVTRGGSFMNLAAECSATARFCVAARERLPMVGFRVLKEVEWSR